MTCLLCQWSPYLGRAGHVGEEGLGLSRNETYTNKEPGGGICRGKSVVTGNRLSGFKY